MRYIANHMLVAPVDPAPVYMLCTIVIQVIALLFASIVPDVVDFVGLGGGAA